MDLVINNDGLEVGVFFGDHVVYGLEGAGGTVATLWGELDPDFRGRLEEIQKQVAGVLCHPVWKLR